MNRSCNNTLARCCGPTYKENIAYIFGHFISVMLPNNILLLLFRYEDNRALFDMEENDLMNDLRDLPRNSAIRKVGGNDYALVLFSMPSTCNL